MNPSQQKLEKNTVPRGLATPLGLIEGVTKEDLATTAVLFFPEKETTNGAKGLLKFDNMEILENFTVQPIALKVSRILLNVNSVNGGPRAELFFTLFLPYTHFTVL